MNKFLVGLSVVVASLALLVSSSIAASFNCNIEKLSQVESTICSVKSLSELDDRLAALYKNATNDLSRKGALKAEQLRWLREQRNKCMRKDKRVDDDGSAYYEDNADVGCLFRVYEERIAALSGTKLQTFTVSDWAGKWEFANGDQYCEGTLEIKPFSDTYLEFNANSVYGLDRQDVSGKAEIFGKHAVYVDHEIDTYPRSMVICEVYITLNSNNLITFETYGSCMGSHDPICAQGAYQKGKPQKRTITLTESGLLANEDQEREFKALVGDDYQYFLRSAQIGSSDEEDYDKLGATVRAMSVQAWAGARKCIVMRTPDGKVMAALLYPDHPVTPDSVRYFTNNTSFARTLPKTIEKWRESFQELPVVGVVVPVQEPAPAATPTAAPEQRATSAVTTLKVKGLYIGMPSADMHTFIRKNFGAIALEENGGEIFSNDAYGWVIQAKCDAEGKIGVIRISDRAVNKLFDAGAMQPSEFAEIFRESYGIPKFEVSDDGQLWYYKSPEGWMVAISSENKELLIGKIAPASTVRKKFD